MTTPNNTVAGLAEKWRKKPVVIEAVQYAHGMEDGFVVDGRYYDKSGPVPRAMHRKPAIKTLEGHHEISAGDWIITGVQGERYPCKPDIFAATYEPADALASPAPSATVGVEDTRVEFERWASKRHGCGLDRWDDTGNYRYDSTNAWWECWCAALQHPAAPSVPVVAAEDQVRRNDDGSLDEVVGSGDYHLEQMDAGHWSLRLGRHLIGLHSTRPIRATIVENDLPAAPSVPPSVAGDAGELPEYVTYEDASEAVKRAYRYGTTGDGFSGPLTWLHDRIRRLATAEQPGSVVQGEAVDGSLTYAEQRKVVEHMTTELGAAIEILQKVQQRAEAIDCQPLPTAPPPAPAAEQGDAAIGFFGNVKVGNAPTATWEEYPGLGKWWVQLRIGPNYDTVLARVYADDVDSLRARANAIAMALNEWPKQCATQPGARGVEGMVLVPREPTEAMRRAWNGARPDDAVPTDDGGLEAPAVSWFAAKYRAMLAAAPSGVRVDDAARALVAKIEAIHADQRYQGVWVFAHNHGQPYTGPNYEAELAALTAALSANEVSRG